MTDKSHSTPTVNSMFFSLFYNEENDSGLCIEFCLEEPGVIDENKLNYKDLVLDVLNSIDISHCQKFTESIELAKYYGFLVARSLTDVSLPLRLIIDFNNEQYLKGQGDSAGLVIALAVIQKLLNINTGLVAATGALSPNSSSGIVNKVGNVDKKIIAFLELIKNDSPGESAVIFYPSDPKFPDSDNDTIQRLLEDERVKRVRLIPITSLLDAVRFLFPEKEEFLPSKLKVNPYNSLRSFKFSDQMLFFGREEDSIKLLGTDKTYNNSDTLIEFLKNNNFNPSDKLNWLSIVGASGVGKNSYVSAQLIPDLFKQRELLGYDFIHVISFDVESCDLFNKFEHTVNNIISLGFTEPAHKQYFNKKFKEIAPFLESDPARFSTELYALFDKMSEFSDGNNRHFFLIVFDQLENLLISDDSNGSHVSITKKNQLIVLFKILSNPNLPHSTLVISTLRSDREYLFESFSSELYDLLSGRCLRKVLRPVPMEGIRAVIEEPAKKAFVEFESTHDFSLVDVILADVNQQIGILPILEYLLYELWEECASNEWKAFDEQDESNSSRKLTFASYRRLGGFEGVINKQFDEAKKILMKKFPAISVEHEMEKVIFELVRVDDGIIHRKSIKWDLFENSPLHLAILDVLIEKRLIVLSV